jgi:hypothetical protein
MHCSEVDITQLRSPTSAIKWPLHLISHHLRRNGSVLHWPLFGRSLWRFRRHPYERPCQF